MSNKACFGQLNVLNSIYSQQISVLACFGQLNVLNSIYSQQISDSFHSLVCAKFLGESYYDRFMGINLSVNRKLTVL